MSDSFIHLQAHSEYSLSKGLLRMTELVGFAKAQGMHSIALTDEMNLFAAVKFYQECEKQGVKPIIGCDLYCHHSDQTAKLHSANHPSFRLTLLVKNQPGYKNLLILLSQAHHSSRKPAVIRDWLTNYAEGLILLLPKASDVGQQLLANNSRLAEQHLAHWLDCFKDNCYFAVQRLGYKDDELYLNQVLKLASRKDCPVVATNDAHFRSAEDYEAHEARVCIATSAVLTDAKRQSPYSPEQYLRTDQEMRELFSDLPELITNRTELAKTANLKLDFGKNFLPDYPVPQGKTVKQLLEEQTRQGLSARFAKNPAKYHDALVQTCEQRIDFELDIIGSMGFAGYFLIVAEFIQWAKTHNIPVGPGRGSGAGSLVAYALGITDIDPLDYDLLFERFLNPERISMPDFDIDFCVEGRDQVIQHVAELYGKDAVGQIITFGTMAAKAVVRDVTRVLGKPYGLGDRIAKMIPFALDMTLSKAVKEEPLLADFIAQDEEADEVMTMAYKLEGLARNLGTHAAGVVIAPGKLSDFTALYYDDQGNVISQYDKDDVETVGLIKFDFLGLKTLTIIKNALEFIQQHKATSAEISLDISTIPLDDSKTFTLLQDGLTDAVFQLESGGMKNVIKDLKPNCFEDIIALVAMYRPGPMDLIPDYIERKHGKQKVSYLHPQLEPVLENTYGIALYQEQVMQIAQVMASYSLGQADILRRAMGKKKKDVMEAQREAFIEGAAKNKIDKSIAEETFAMIEKFAGYGFNKSHAACYALIAYQTAWLKAHYPQAFFAAVFNAEIQNTDKIVQFRKEAERFAIALIMPHVNHSDYKFTLNQQKAIVFGLGAIKGIGKGPAEAITKARQSGGTFTGIVDFCSRVGTEQLNKRVMEALIYSGALDGLCLNQGLNRASLLKHYDYALNFANQYQQQKQSTNLSLFDFDPASVQHQPAKLEPIDELPVMELLNLEKQVLGFYISGHPMDCFAEELALWRIRPIRQIKHKIEDRLIAGILLKTFRKRTKTGQDFVVLQIEDHTDSAEVTVYPEVYQNVLNTLADKLQIHAVFIINVDVKEPWQDKEKERKDLPLRLIAKSIKTLEQFREERKTQTHVQSMQNNSGQKNTRLKDTQSVNLQKKQNKDAQKESAQKTSVVLRLPHDQVDKSLARLQSLLLKHHSPQGIDLMIDYQDPSGQKHQIKLGANWRVRYSDALLADLAEGFSREQVCSSL